MATKPFSFTAATHTELIGILARYGPAATRLLDSLKHDVAKGRELHTAASEGTSDAEHRRELGNLLKAIERVSHYTLGTVTRGVVRLMQEEARGLLRSDSPERSRLCRRCLPNVFIPHTALHDAIIEELERPLRTLVIEPGHEGAGIPGTAVRREDGKRVPARLVAKKVRDKPKYDGPTKQARDSFIRRVASTLQPVLLRMDDGDLADILHVCLRAVSPRWDVQPRNKRDGGVTNAMRLLIDVARERQHGLPKRPAK